MNFVHGLHFRNIRGDIYGGLTAAVVALPLALAFGVASGAGIFFMRTDLLVLEPPKACQNP